MSTPMYNLPDLLRWAEGFRQAMRAEYGQIDPMSIERSILSVAHSQMNLNLTTGAFIPSLRDAALRDSILSVEVSHIIIDIFSTNKNFPYFAAQAVLKTLRGRFGASLPLWRLVQAAIALGVITDAQVVQHTERRRIAIEIEYQGWDAHRRAYPHYFTTPLPLLESVDMPTPDLTYIHPIFHPDNFSLDVDYDSITLVLQLASRMLTAKGMQPLWWKTMLAKLEWVGTLPGRPSDLILGHAGDLTTAESAEIKERLLLLAKCILFQEDREGMSGVSMCSLMPTQAPQPLLGVKSIIKISFQDLHHAARLPGERQEGYFSLHASLRLAFTLIHEITHAAMAAARGPPHNGTDPPCYFDNAATDEEGWESEAQLIGGILSPVFEACKFANLPHAAQPLPIGTVLCLTPWPSAVILRDYASTPSTAPIRVREHRQGTVSDRTYPIINPRKWVYDFFTEQLWERVEREGLHVLRPNVHCYYITGPTHEGGNEIRGGPFV